ncbi:peptidase [Paenibacillus sp. J31TS4]|uniref:EF-P 5-aminopentanol modification-associated protein YfmH n=1 Tax=Paenibacillus sp. J31TS4 TaxID=2807195 RepID=UPI001B020ADF|nr:pitrilysin family protein [Paenibacillus sp. J31TS4]GIP36878.1 peptidase [Paenibacillus sp. J31TS4]
MQVREYKQLKETLYTETLENGLKVYLLPKPGFQKTYATFSTRYGSVDNRFRVGDGQIQDVPDGIAHFLEHKMFEEPTGDIFATFAEQGASANAFTSFDRTLYLFSATDRIEENVTTLLDFVQNPYFTDENVEKEKGIIGQEIKMYDDHPDFRVYYGLLEAMFHRHPIRIDIAGTIESIAQITKETLYTCYRTFYHPSNMGLFIAGGIDPDNLLALIRRNQAGKTFEPQGPIERFYPEEPDSVCEPVKRFRLPVSEPKCLFGFKEGTGPIDAAQLLRQEVLTEVMLDALFGPSSDLYQTLYEEELISDSFGFDYNASQECRFSVLGGDTPDPDRLLVRFRELLEPVIASGLAAEDFERSRKKKIGGFLRMLNSTEAVANTYTTYAFRGIDLFDCLSLYGELTLEEANRRLRDHFRWDRLAVSIVSAQES